MLIGLPEVWTCDNKVLEWGQKNIPGLICFFTLLVSVDEQRISYGL